MGTRAPLFMKHSPLESSLLAAAQRHLKALAHRDPTLVWRKRHGSPFTTAGDPDLTGLWHGTHFEIELKRPGESPTLLQAARLAQWATAGARTFTVHSISELQAALESIHKTVVPG